MSKKMMSEFGMLELAAKAVAKKTAARKAAAKPSAKAKPAAKKPASTPKGKAPAAKKPAEASTKKPAAKKAAPPKPAKSTKQPASALKGKAPAAKKPAKVVEAKKPTKSSPAKPNKVPAEKKAPAPAAVAEKKVAPKKQPAAKKTLASNGKSTMAAVSGDDRMSKSELDNKIMSAPAGVFDAATLAAKIDTLIKGQVKVDVQALDLPASAAMLAEIGDMTVKEVIDDLNDRQKAVGRQGDPRINAVLRVLAKHFGRATKLGPEDVRAKAQEHLDKFMALEKAGNDEATLAAIKAFAVAKGMAPEVKAAVVLSAAYSRGVNVPPTAEALRQPNLIQRVLTLAIIPHILEPKKPVVESEVTTDLDEGNPEVPKGDDSTKAAGGKRKPRKKTPVADDVAAKAKQKEAAGKYEKYLSDLVKLRVTKDRAGFDELMKRFGAENVNFIRYVALRSSNSNWNWLSTSVTKASALAYVRRRWSHDSLAGAGKYAVNVFTDEKVENPTGITKTRIKVDKIAKPKKARAPAKVTAKKPTVKKAAAKPAVKKSATKKKAGKAK